MYKFIPYDEYMNSDYVTSHPNARVNAAKTEVVLSCNNHEAPCSCITHAEAVTYIAANWTKPTAP